ncbi:JAB domain-containing protein [Calditerrivibrio nitroreducens]|uniref:DNA repair protein RadC n=1 Tax=Calditerrivibrio nitroreducens (strain DSM 19672 / NBRC 101217 / Yu37-1) TaxID=768670 RepID=E4TK19_CALNY|nr:DNA repair protein RadC [Calditerrivibrio nitroreducens]ADR18270.1 DNA repair protein RadC [Calditerrivibrio nitroreducens DSM 19672]
MEKHYLGHRKRLKERFKGSPESIPDYELIELLIGYVIKGRDVKKESKELVKFIEGNFNNIFFKDIKNVDGIGEEVDLLFKIIKEFLRRLSLHNHSFNKDIIKSPRDVYDYIKNSIGYQDKESFMVILLNSAGNVIDWEVLFNGTVNCSQVHVREVAEYALKNKAVGVIVAHNHPSGKLEPSKDDREITIKIKKALDLFDINLLDHVLVTPYGYLSFKEREIF